MSTLSIDVLLTLPQIHPPGLKSEFPCLKLAISGLRSASSYDQALSNDNSTQHWFREYFNFSHASLFSFWAVAQKETKCCPEEYRGILFICSFVCLSLPSPLRPKICPLRPEIWLLMPQICPHRPEICPLGPEFGPLRPEI